MKFWQTLAFTVMSAIFFGGFALAADSVHEFKMKSIDGEDVDMSEFKGKVLLIVNVASECGLTDQYEELQALHDKYGEKGLVVIGFPCNQFGGQEPGTEVEIKKFCTDRFKVTFPMMSKIEVNGDKQAKLYEFLKSQTDNKKDIGWNFEKFIVGKDGKVVGRISPRTKPDAEEVVNLIETALK